MQLFRRDQGKAAGEIEAHLTAEGRQGAGAGPVGLFLAFVEDFGEEIEIGAHVPFYPMSKSARQKAIAL